MMTSKMDRHTLYNYLNKLVDNNVVGGMTLAVITKESRELFFVGKSDEENYVSVDSIYDLASVSKVIGTLSGILKLIEEGLITLDTKV
ncbi:MAG TPA: serine hydrolase, partial [Erysipelotrichaceae bacterium]|nr:serine hydrolase [Erysipelotrichaceae bacterium]